MKAFILLTLAIVAVPASLAVDKVPKQAPVSWGVIAQNAGCVIFAESFNSSGTILGLTVKNKPIGKLTVIEALDYAFDPKEVIETQENMDSLALRAEKDRIKYLKIPEKHPTELLDRARAMCKQTMTPAAK